MSASTKINRREALRRVGALLGGALAAPTVAGFLGGCRADPSENWQPQVFSPEQNELVTTLSERILPATDTPGAQAAQVNRYIDKMLADWYPPEEKESFLNGLARLDARAQEAHGQPFMELTPEAQTALLSRMDEAAYAEAPTAPEPEEEESDEGVEEKAFAQGQGGETVEEVEEPLKEDTTQAAPSDSAAADKSVEETAFFRRLKELTLLGYYTSEVGATQELRHQIAFPSYQGCVPYGPDDRTWA